MDTTTDVLDPATGLLTGYDLPEQYAILEHKYFLGIEMGFDPGLQCAISNWEAYHAGCWRRQRQRNDCIAQMAEIEHHRQTLLLLNSDDVSWEAAARDWIRRHAEAWRERRQRQTTG